MQRVGARFRTAERSERRRGELDQQLRPAGDGRRDGFAAPAQLQHDGIARRVTVVHRDVVLWGGGGEGQFVREVGCNSLEVSHPIHVRSLSEYTNRRHSCDLGVILGLESLRYLSSPWFGTKTKFRETKDNGACLLDDRRSLLTSRV